MNKNSHENWNLITQAAQSPSAFPVRGGRPGWVSQSAYCAWESDRATPGARHYGPLAILFEVDIRELLSVDQLADCRPEATYPLSAARQPATLEGVLIKTQQETIGLQKQRIENLEAENQRLRRSPEAS